MPSAAEALWKRFPAPCRRVAPSTEQATGGSRFRCSRTSFGNTKGGAGMTTRRSQRADEESLRRCLEGVVAVTGGSRPAVAWIEWRRSVNSSSYASDIVTVRLATGEELQLFLKDFSLSQFPKDDPEEQRERELQVYRDL